MADDRQDLRERFASWLDLHYKYALEDVAMSHCKGYLQIIKPCDRECIQQAYLGPLGTHYHTLGVHGALYGYQDARGRFISQYRLWDELHEILPMIDPAHPSQRA